MGKIYHGSLDDAPSWSVPWQTPKAQTYALPENLALHQRATLAADLDGEPKPKGKKLKKQATAKNLRGPAFEGADVPDNTFQDGKVADLAVSTLRDLGTKPTPFFLAVGFTKPHLPFVSPKKYWDLYDPAKIQLSDQRGAGGNVDRSMAQGLAGRKALTRISSATKPSP
jgi:hypothetical protein